MAYQTLDSPSDIDINPSLNDDKTDFYIGAEGSDEESDIEEDILVKLEEDGGNSGDFSDTGASTIWSDDLRDIHVEEFIEETGPRHSLPPDATPYDYFSLFIEEEFYNTVAEQTNLYAQQGKAAKPNIVGKWKECTAQDMKLFIYINIMFGIHQLPNFYMYWSNDELLGVPQVSGVMGKTRFQSINRYYHLNDITKQQSDRTHEDYDALFKVRPLFDMVRRNSQKYYQPTREISIDNAMIAFNDRLFFKQYILGKPSPLGIKAWCCAESKTGYLLNFSIHTGKPKAKSILGQGYDVVMDLGKDYFYKNHHFFYDNFFSSVKLATDLLQYGTYSCSTIKPSRKSWPEKLKSGKIIPGTTRMMQDGNLLATRWHHYKRDVNILSTNCDPKMSSQIHPTKDGCTHTSSVPKPVLSFNASAGGVNLNDQYRSYYPIGRRSHKWWRSLHWFLFQVAIINSFIIYRASTSDRRKLSHIQFRLEIARSLRKGATIRGRRVVDQPSLAGIMSLSAADHRSVRLIGRKKDCFQCKKDKRKTGSNRGVQTVFGCYACNVHLCKGKCFATFHNDLTK